MGVSVGTGNFKRDFLQEVVKGEPAELVRALVPMEDTQANFQISCIYLPFPACHTSFAQIHPPSHTMLL